MIYADENLCSKVAASAHEMIITFHIRFIRIEEKKSSFRAGDSVAPTMLPRLFPMSHKPS